MAKKRYTFTVRTPGGKVVTRTVTAESQQAVIETLQKQGYTVIRVRERAVRELPLMARLRSVPLKVLVIFSRQFALLLSAGITLARALDVLEEQTQHRGFKRILHQLRLDVEAGNTLADSMRKFPRTFSNFFVSMVRAGEIGGALEAIMERMAVFFERELELRHKIRSAMMYPLFVLIISFLITLGIMMYIVPQFADLYESFSEGKVQLPALTQRLIDISDWMLVNWPYVVFGPIIFVILFWNFRKSRWGHKLLDPIIIRLPIVGPLSRKVAISRFSRTLGTLTESGVPLLQALDVVADTADNAVVTRSVLFIHDRVREGTAVASAMRQAGIFPPMVYHMVSVGEEAGNLEMMLYKLADFYDAEIDATVRGLASLIEPILIVIIGGIVGVIVVALYLPIFNIVNLFGGA